jgi:hypothetical protein
MVLNTPRFVSVPTDKILKDCSQAKVGAVPREMFADVYWYEDSPLVLVWRTHSWCLSKQFRYPYVTIHIIKRKNILMLILHTSFTICRNSDMFRSTLNIFRDLLNINKTNVLIQAVLAFNNSLEMIKIDRNISELWQIVCKKYNFKISAFVGFILLFVY